MKPSVYIIIPMYNAVNTIGFAANSALSQTGVDIKLILVDHGSTDNTWEYVKKQYLWRENVYGIQLQRGPNERHSASRPLNAGMSLAVQLGNQSNNSWVVRLDADDVFYKRETLVSIINISQPITKLLSGSMIFINSETNEAQVYSQRKEFDSLKELENGAVYAYPHHATLIRLSLMRSVLYEDGYCYYEKVGYGEDMDLSLRLFSRCREEEIVFSHIPLTIKELSGKTISNQIKLSQVLRDHLTIFLRNRSLPMGLLAETWIWFLIEYCGSVGKKINVHRSAPAMKYANNNLISYTKIKSLKDAWGYISKARIL